MTANVIMRDERTVATENASYRRAYLVLSFGLLVSVAYRAFVRSEASWDLLGLVIGSGFVATFYQANARVLTKRWVYLTVASMVIAVVVAIVIALVRR